MFFEGNFFEFMRRLPGSPDPKFNGDAAFLEYNIIIALVVI